MPKRTRSYKPNLLERLKDPAYAVEYLNAILEDADSDDSVLLTALRYVAEAQQMARVAESADVTRESLYRMLSESGNPTYTNLMKIIRALGFRLNFELPARP